MVADAVLRQFLLDRVDAEERQRIESLFITDASFNERLLSLEQDLIDDYFDGSLSRVERESFRRQYAATEEQRRKLEVSKSVKEWADRQSPKRSLFRRGLVVPIAAAVLVGTILLVIWIRSGSRVADEQELARINSRAAMAETPAGIRSITVSPINTRTIEAGSEVDTAGAELIELRLLWIQQERYPVYRAVLRKVGGSEAFTIQSVYAENQNVIRVRLPTRLLSRGQFRILLTGDAPDALSDEYSFFVPR